MNQKYLTKLTAEERQQLEQLLSSGIAPARTLTHARILLKSDCSRQGANWSYGRICEAFDVAPLTVANVRKRFAEEGLAKALNRKKPEREYEHCLDGEAEAHLIAMVCGKPPEGKDRWTLRLLRKQMVELSYAETVSHETIRTTLKKMNLSLG
jgi:Fe2+ or Zn2+ uptake regulation protein